MLVGFVLAGMVTVLALVCVIQTLLLLQANQRLRELERKDQVQPTNQSENFSASSKH